MLGISERRYSGLTFIPQYKTPHFPSSCSEFIQFGGCCYKRITGRGKNHDKVNAYEREYAINIIRHLDLRVIFVTVKTFMPLRYSVIYIDRYTD